MMTKIALAFSTMPDSSLTTIVKWAKQAEDAGIDGVFMTEANNDSLACCLGLGFNTSRIMLGTAITNIYLRHPNLLANEVAALSEFTDGRFILGLGTGHRPSNAALGIDMGATAAPMKKMRETVGALRRMFDGRTNPKISGRQPIFLAGVSRPMVRLAGEIADGVIFNFFPPERIKQAMRELHEGIRNASRDSNDVVPALFATAFISHDVEAARRPARTLLSRYGAMPYYGNMLAMAGFEREISGIRAAGGDAKAAFAAVSEALIDATVLVGPEERVRERLDELTARGIGWAIVFVNPVNEDRDSSVKRIIRALRP
jgi:5,10-methylenetetrahydromethanopterin reductase